jgi:hypothetical protein
MITTLPGISGGTSVRAPIAVVLAPEFLAAVPGKQALIDALGTTASL